MPDWLKFVVVFALGYFVAASGGMVHALHELADILNSL